MYHCLGIVYHVDIVISKIGSLYLLHSFCNHQVWDIAGRHGFQHKFLFVLSSSICFLLHPACLVRLWIQLPYLMRLWLTWHSIQQLGPCVVPCQWIGKEEKKSGSCSWIILFWAYFAFCIFTTCSCVCRYYLSY